MFNRKNKIVRVRFSDGIKTCEVLKVHGTVLELSFRDKEGTTQFRVASNWQVLK